VEKQKVYIDKEIVGHLRTSIVDSLQDKVIVVDEPTDSSINVGTEGHIDSGRSRRSALQDFIVISSGLEASLPEGMMTLVAREFGFRSRHFKKKKPKVKTEKDFNAIKLAEEKRLKKMSKRKPT
jgi:hypothetical protein